MKKMLFACVSLVALTVASRVDAADLSSLPVPGRGPAFPSRL